MTDKPWHAIPMTDEEYAQSYGPELGFDRFRCSTCNALLRDGICLNACHLGPAGKAQFAEHMRAFADARRVRDR
jgi:hypothetical protein